MFGLKKYGRRQSAKLHEILSEKLKPEVEGFSLKLRFPGRIRLWNRWGKKHPKRLTVYYLTFAFFLLSLNLIFSFAGMTKEDVEKDPLELSSLSRNNPVDGMMSINRNRKIIQDAVSDYATAKIAMASRLDSLCNLPRKSRSDSIEISNLWNLLNQPNNKTNDSTTH